MTLPMILCVISELIYNASLIFLKFISTGNVDLSYSIKKIVLPEIFFSLLITLLLYRVILHFNRALDYKEDKRGQNVA